MSASAPRKDPRHRRTNPRRSLVTRRVGARQPIIAVLLGVVGFALLVAYSAIGAGGAVAHAVGETKTEHVRPETLTQTGDCTADNATGAHFIINQIAEADAPDTITVFFDNNPVGVESKAIDTQKHNNESGYDIFYASGLTITDATAVVPVAYDGNFNLSHYLCGPPPSPSSPPTSPPTSPSTTPPTSPSTTPPTSPSTTPPTSPSTTPPTTPISSSSAPVKSTSEASTSESSESSSAAAQSTSPFVPGPGETGDTAPASSPILKQGLLAGGLASLVAALGMSLQMLKRRGEHS